MTLDELWLHCAAILPELILAVVICAVVVADMVSPLGRSRRFCGGLALAGVLLALLVLLAPSEFMRAAMAGSTFRGMIVHDGMSIFFRIAFMIGTAATILFSLSSRETAGYRQGEYMGLMLGATLGACFLAAAGNFLMLVLALETLSLCSYVLAGFIKHQRQSAEAGLKYTLYGAVASGVMLFGISYLYGMTGTLNINAVMEALLARGGSLSVGAVTFLLAFILLLVGLGFKMAMVPFQAWAPDVYQGAPTPITAYLSVVSKGAGLAALMRVTLPLFDQNELLGGEPSTLIAMAHLPVLMGVLSMATMTFGNLVALRQTDVKRMLAYSSIAHAGYILMGMTIFRADAREAMMFYFFMYMIMNLGAFWVVIVLVNRAGSANIEDFRALWGRSPALMWMMFVFLISLTGLPPTIGFAAKFQLFGVVVSAGLDTMREGVIGAASAFYITLALIGVINSVISLFYYMKIIGPNIFRPAEKEAPFRIGVLDKAYAATLAVVTVGLFLAFPAVQRLMDGF
jgi:NADH-quinone oxidoreductase subunit N